MSGAATSPGADGEEKRAAASHDAGQELNEAVDDVTKHPAFSEPIRRIATIYDLACSEDARDATTFVDPATGRRHGNMWLIPRSAEDLAARRRAHRLWAEPSYGLMGRTPDHVACVMTAFASWRELFDRGGAQFGDHVVRFHEKVRDEDNACSRASKKTVQIVKKPGASPVMFGKFLMPTTVFLGLGDIAKNLPSYQVSIAR